MFTFFSSSRLGFLSSVLSQLAPVHFKQMVQCLQLMPTELSPDANEKPAAKQACVTHNFGQLIDGRIGVAC